MRRCQLPPRQKCFQLLCIADSLTQVTRQIVPHMRTGSSELELLSPKVLCVRGTPHALSTTISITAGDRAPAAMLAAEPTKLCTIDRDSKPLLDKYSAVRRHRYRSLQRTYSHTVLLPIVVAQCGVLSNAQIMRLLQMNGNPASASIRSSSRYQACSTQWIEDLMSDRVTHYVTLLSSLSR